MRPDFSPRARKLTEITKRIDKGREGLDPRLHLKAYPHELQRAFSDGGYSFTEIIGRMFLVTELLSIARVGGEGPRLRKELVRQENSGQWQTTLTTAKDGKYATASFAYNGEGEDKGRVQTHTYAQAAIEGTGELEVFTRTDTGGPEDVKNTAFVIFTPTEGERVAYLLRTDKERTEYVEFSVNANNELGGTLSQTRREATRADLRPLDLVNVRTRRGEPSLVTPYFLAERKRAEREQAESTATLEDAQSAPILEPALSSIDDGAATSDIKMGRGADLVKGDEDDHAGVFVRFGEGANEREVRYTPGAHTLVTVGANISPVQADMLGRFVSREMDGAPINVVSVLDRDQAEAVLSAGIIDNILDDTGKLIVIVDDGLSFDWGQIHGSKRERLETMTRANQLASELSQRVDALGLSERTQVARSSFEFYPTGWDKTYTFNMAEPEEAAPIIAEFFGQAVQEMPTFTGPLERV